MQESQSMFSEFDALSKKDWLNRVKNDLQEKPYSTLQWSTYEGFTLEPYYTRRDLKNIEHLKSLHNATLLSTHSEGSESSRKWVNNQYIRVKNEKDANAIALEALNSGADGLFFDVSRLPDVRLPALLENIHLNHCSVSFFAGNDAERLFSDYLQFATDQGVKPEELHGIFNFDPVGEICNNGLIDSDHFQSFAAINSETARMPHFYGITINTGPFHDSGASAVQEIAFGLNIAVSYLDHLTEKGMSPAQAVENLCISVSVGTSYFMEIAKLRVIRFLFSRIVQAYGLENYHPGELYIHARTDIWSGSLTDPYTNLLRHTTQAMSAILGGCNALTVLPFNATYADPTPFSRRMSRNVCSILKEEAYFDKVADAAAGSYYIDAISDKLIDASWNLFLQVEEKGGFSRAFQKGFIQEEVKKVRRKRLEDIATRKQKLVGINAYCNPEEQITGKEAAYMPEHAQLLLPQRRGAGFEQLRFRTEAHIANGNPRPQALLLMFGDPAMRRARAAFAADFLHCAGFTTKEETIVPQSARLNTLLGEHKNGIIVFCAADADYETHIPELADYTRRFFDGLLIVAGRPGTLKEQVKHSAIDGFINLHSDALDVLNEFQDKLFV